MYPRDLENYALNNSLRLVCPSMKPLTQRDQPPTEFALFLIGCAVIHDTHCQWRHSAVDAGHLCEQLAFCPNHGKAFPNADRSVMQNNGQPRRQSQSRESFGLNAGQCSPSDARRPAEVAIGDLSTSHKDRQDSSWRGLPSGTSIRSADAWRKDFR